MFTRLRLIAASALLLGLLVPAASATLVMNISGQFPNRGQDTSWLQDPPGSNPLAANSGYAGAYSATLTPAPNGVSNPVAVWCIDLFHGLNFNTNYTVNSVLSTSNSLPDLTRVSRAAWIFSDVFPNIAAIANAWGSGATASTVGAALQLALWEVMVDSTANFADGAFRFNTANGGTSTLIQNLATAILFGSNTVTLQNLGLVNHTGAVNTQRAALTSVLVSTNWGANQQGPQRMLYYNPQSVPEPSTYALLASALLALFAIRKR